MTRWGGPEFERPEGGKSKNLRKLRREGSCKLWGGWVQKAACLETDKEEKTLHSVNQGWKFFVWSKGSGVCKERLLRKELRDGSMSKRRTGR